MDRGPRLCDDEGPGAAAALWEACPNGRHPWHQLAQMEAVHLNGAQPGWFLDARKVHPFSFGGFGDRLRWFPLDKSLPPSSRILIYI